MNLANQLLLLIVVISSISLFSHLTWTNNKSILTGIDDANIYFVYMQNLSSGEGLVYNHGERVEGFTSMLWVLIGGVIMLFTKNPESTLIILNVIFISCSLFYLIRYLNEKLQVKYVVSFPIIFIIGMLGIIPGYFDWTIISLLETGLWSALIITSAVSLQYTIDGVGSKWDRIIFLISIFLLTLTRPEALLWNSFLIGFYFLVLLQAKNNLKKIIVTLLPSSAVFVLSALILIGFRYIYFGYPLPNTYYAKVSADTSSNINDGFDYINQYFTKSNPMMLAVMVLTFIMIVYQGIANKKWKINRYLFFGSSIVFLIVILYSGGDHFDLGRFIQPFAPLVFAGLVILLPSKLLNHIATPIVTSIALLIFYQADILPLTIKNASEKSKFEEVIINEFEIAQESRKFYTKLNRYLDKMSEYPSLGVLTAGSSKYIYKGYVYDMLGLNNVEMAHADKVKEKTIFKNHASFNKEVFYKQHPDLFFMDICPNFYPSSFLTDGKFNYKIPKFSLEVFKNIPYDSTFQASYRLALIERKGEDTFLATFASADWLNKVDTAQYKLTY